MTVSDFNVSHVIDVLLALTFLEWMGWIGALCLAFCAVPQAIMSVKQKHSHGISKGLLWLWSLGELFTLIYIWYGTRDLPLLVNYGLNVIFIGIVIWYKVFPRETLVDPVKRT